MVKEKIRLKTPDEISALREGGKILKDVLGLLRERALPGVSTGELNTFAEQYLASLGVEPAFKGYQGFPAALCTSINHRVVHGIPRFDEYLQDGDIIGLDFGVRYKGLVTDSCITIPVGRISPELEKLLEITEKALEIGLRQAIPGNRVGDISAAIQSFVEPFGFGLVRELIGHGVGYSVHEAPEVPNIGKRGCGPELEPGLVIAIEPIVTLGKPYVRTLSDGWSIETLDKSHSAHFEHSVAITPEGQLILTN